MATNAETLLRAAGYLPAYFVAEYGNELFWVRPNADGTNVIIDDPAAIGDDPAERDDGVVGTLADSPDGTGRYPFDCPNADWPDATGYPSIADAIAGTNRLY